MDEPMSQQMSDRKTVDILRNHLNWKDSTTVEMINTAVG